MCSNFCLIEFLTVCFCQVDKWIVFYASDLGDFFIFLHDKGNFYVKNEIKKKETFEQLHRKHTMFIFYVEHFYFVSERTHGSALAKFQ